MPCSSGVPTQDARPHGRAPIGESTPVRSTSHPPLFYSPTPAVQPQRQRSAGQRRRTHFHPRHSAGSSASSGASGAVDGALLAILACSRVSAGMNRGVSVHHRSFIVPNVALRCVTLRCVTLRHGTCGLECPNTGYAASCHSHSARAPT